MQGKRNLALWIAALLTVPVLADSVKQQGPANRRAHASSTVVAPATELPPARPLSLTAAQIRALEQLAGSASHAVPADLRAAYSSREQELKWSPSEVGARAFYATYATTIATILIIAL